MKKERLGYFGGTFDPPHLGHIILAVETSYHLNLDAFYWIITPDPPHKKDQYITPVEQRLEMLNLAVKDQGDFFISDVDLTRDPPHYAVDTVTILKEQHPSAELVYVIGEDSLKDLPQWYQASRFIDLVDQLAVVPRPLIDPDLTELERTLPGLTSKISFIPQVMIEISSTVIRERAGNAEPYEHFLPPGVAAYIEEHHLYHP